MTLLSVLGLLRRMTKSLFVHVCIFLVQVINSRSTVMHTTRIICILNFSPSPRILTEERETLFFSLSKAELLPSPGEIREHHDGAKGAHSAATLLLLMFFQTCRTQTAIVDLPGCTRKPNQDRGSGFGLSLDFPPLTLNTMSSLVLGKKI